ncbi:SubName: Full=Uncharacterized protein {ECO:0000313/EMBL:CCA66764.1} [Serendipita indica DSM 11827]|uniref:Uncharacterized protein n=1 Tax=Serendipita indica (strain DSM 11827) TaxID=1109443 RepID=G4T5Y8_SERID|nr:SubName: Full=Uncharacterized protein {ECO:0000313/EMBL:CCA66764.1} [Serendipita indica DSM 11827]CCA66764.1 hypothetical protein PIIN_00444 [Serendipita indica DSM 11827]
MSVTVLESTQVDDTSPNVTYAGAEWTVHTNVQSIFHLYNNTDTFTDRQGATATLTFYGNAVEYWGNQGPYHGPCDVSVDGYYCATVNSHASVDDDPILLWSSSGPNGRSLDLGMHTLEVKVKDASYPNVCEIDRFVVNVTRSSGGTSGGSSATVAGNGGGSTNPPTGKSGPPVAAIAGAVGGAAALALLLLAWWWFARRRKQKDRLSQQIDAIDDKRATLPTLAPGHATKPSPRTEKPGFGPGGGHPGDPTSALLATPVSTPPPSTASYTQHHLAAGFDARATSPPASTVSSGYLNPHASPQPTPRPMSVVSSTSGAPTMSQYSSGAFTSETAAFPIPGFVPHQQQQFTNQSVHTSVRHDVQQQSYPEDSQNPVWAVPLGTQSRPLSPASSSQPTAATAATNTVDPATQGGGSSAYPPEKAQYRGTAAYPPEKARYSGPALSSTSGAGGSGSNVAATSGSGPSTAAPTSNAQDIMNPAVPEAPPPAYS